MKWKTGDRFQHFPNKEYNYIYEYVNDYPDETCVIVTSSGTDGVNHWMAGETSNWRPCRDEYLGNYGKASKFTELYDILNGKD